MRRSERLIRVARRILDRPSAAVSLSDLSEQLEAAKSSISEDVSMLRDAFESEESGTIETIQGAQGGVRFRVRVPSLVKHSMAQELVSRLSEPWRILPGGFLYMSDILGDPHVLDFAGRLFAEKFYTMDANVIVTIETKGIPLAVSAARYLNVPVVIVRREHRVTDGASLSKHYVSGSERRIQSMFISTRAMPKLARALIIDDFMRAGATVKAVEGLLSEFNAEVVGTGVFMSMKDPVRKLVSDYTSLFTLCTLEAEEGVLVTQNLL